MSDASRRATDGAPTPCPPKPERRPSLRRELLGQLGLLAGAALALGLWTERLFRLLAVPEPRAGGVLALLVAADLLIFLALGDVLLRRYVAAPVRAMAAAAERIAAGAYETRLPEPATAELAQLARSVNQMAGELLRQREVLAANVQSLERTNRALMDLQQEVAQTAKLAALGRLAAGLAHEIGNPLAAARNYAALLRRRGGDPALLEGLERELTRIDRLVGDVRESARPGAAALDAVDVAAAADEALGLLRLQGRLDGLEVRTQWAPDLPAVRAERHRLVQVFVNLILNAADAMPNGGRLTLRAEPATLDVEADAVPRRVEDPPEADFRHLRRWHRWVRLGAPSVDSGAPAVRVEVEDTGSGIEPDILEDVFDPFFTTKPPGRGTGLGLTLVAASVMEWGGRVAVRSRPGQGATFVLWLPVHAGVGR